MEKFEKIVVLKNEIEANLVGSILNEQKIPHLIRSYRDSAFDGFYQQQKGWGYIEAPASFKGAIETIYNDISEKVDS